MGVALASIGGLQHRSKSQRPIDLRYSWIQPTFMNVCMYVVYVHTLVRYTPHPSVSVIQLRSQGETPFGLDIYSQKTYKFHNQNKKFRLSKYFF